MISRKPSFKALFNGIHDKGNGHIWLVTGFVQSVFVAVICRPAPSWTTDRCERFASVVPLTLDQRRLAEARHVARFAPGVRTDGTPNFTHRVGGWGSQ